MIDSIVWKDGPDRSTGATNDEVMHRQHLRKGVTNDTSFYIKARQACARDTLGQVGTRAAP